MVPYLITENSVTVNVNGKTYTVYSDDKKKFDAIKNCIRYNDFDTLERIVSNETVVSKWLLGSGFYIEDGIVYSNDNEPLPAVITNRIIHLINEGIPHNHLIEFWKSCKRNPNPDSVKQLYTFLEHNNIPITDKGSFVAYKGTTSEYFDKHSRTIRYRIGFSYSMLREDVEFDPSKPCGRGYHVGTFEYADGWAGIDGHVLLVEVFPEHVVSVPTDCSAQKCRVCKLFVIDECVNREPLTQHSRNSCANKNSPDILIEDEVPIGNWMYIGEIVKTVPKGAKKIKKSKYPKVFKCRKDIITSIHSIRNNKNVFYYVLWKDGNLVRFTPKHSISAGSVQLDRRL